MIKNNAEKVKRSIGSFGTKSTKSNDLVANDRLIRK